MRFSPILALLPALCLATSASAQDAPTPAGNAEQLVQLFAHTCLAYAGKVTALRDMLDSHHVPALGDKAAAMFLSGAKGKGYDASTDDNRMALISEDADICTTLSEKADGKTVVSLMEAGLQTLHANAHLTHEENDPLSPDLHHRHYALTTKANQPYELIVSTSGEPGHIQAIITIGPKPKG